jgi:hypothetical protein
MPELFKAAGHHFPLQIPVVDRDNPFFLDVTTWVQAPERFGHDVHLSVNYKDLADNTYSFDAQLDVANAIPPIMMGTDTYERIAKGIESLAVILKGKNKR